MRYVWDDEYTVRMLDGLPPSVPGFVTVSPDGHYNIYINARLNDVQQRDALDHELKHIARGDFDNDRSIHEIENDVIPRLPTHNPLDVPGVIMAADLLTMRQRRQLRAVQITPERAIAFDDGFEPGGQLHAEPDPQPRRPVVRPIHPVPLIPTYTSWPPPPETLTREQYTIIYGDPANLGMYFYNHSGLENGMVIGL